MQLTTTTPSAERRTIQREIVRIPRRRKSSLSTAELRRIVADMIG